MTPEQTVWLQAYCAALSAGYASSSPTAAEIAVKEFNTRFPKVARPDITNRPDITKRPTTWKGNTHA